MSNFIAITVEKVAGRIAYIGTSAGKSLYVETGDISSLAALHFLYSLHTLRKRKRVGKLSFVWYAATLDIEYLLRDLPAVEKDKAFSTSNVEKARGILRDQIKTIKLQIRHFKAQNCVIPLEQAERELRALKAELLDSEYAHYAGYYVKNRQGKSFTLYRAGEKCSICKKVFPSHKDETHLFKAHLHRGITVYDLCAFFTEEKPLPDVARTFLGATIPYLDRNAGASLPLWENETTRAEALEATKCYVRAETDTIKRLAERLSDYFQAQGFDITRWYGASAVANACLARWRVRSSMWRQDENNTPRALWEGLTRGYYGSRQETVKLGTAENVYLYDLNSAFAYAASLLACTNKRWRYVRHYNPHELMALWFVEYDLPDSAYYGVLPHRTARGSIHYRKKGRGWYYAPEVRTLLRAYPESFIIKHGYVLPYTRVSFGTHIEAMYRHRMELKRQGEPGQLLFKSILQAVYGKFGQTVGEAQYYNAAWAGWITSFVRAMLFEACRGNERNIIAFTQDAIHSRVPLDLPLSDKLGEWKLVKYEKVLYLQNGIWWPYGKGRGRKRGLEWINYEAAIKQLNENATFEAAREYFVGWRLARSRSTELDTTGYRSMEQMLDAVDAMPGAYLERVREQINIRPFDTRARDFGRLNFDWRSELKDSRILRRDDGRESARKSAQENGGRFDMMLDVIEARRY